MVRITETGKSKGLALPTVLFMVFLLNMSFLVAFQSWDIQIKREREKELLWRGKKIAKAIDRFYSERRMYPESIEQLYNMKYIRKPYKDPMVKDGEWDYIRPPMSLNQISGVKSKLDEKSFYVYEDKENYTEWEFKAESTQFHKPQVRPGVPRSGDIRSQPRTETKP